MSIYVNNDTRVAQGKAQPDYSFLEPFFDKAFRIIRRNYAAPGSDTISIKTIKASYKDYRDRLKKHSMSTPIVMHLSDYSGDIRPIKKYNIMDTWLQTAMRLYAEYKTGYKPRSSVFSYRKKNGENTIRDYIKSWNTEKFLYVDIASFCLLEILCLYFYLTIIWTT